MAGREDAYREVVEIMRETGLHHFYTNTAGCTCGWGPGSVPEHSRHVEGERLDALLASPSVLDHLNQGDD